MQGGSIYGDQSVYSTILTDEGEKPHMIVSFDAEKHLTRFNTF
jgi:hypothetical protein